MNSGVLLWTLLILPPLAGLACLAIRQPRPLLALLCTAAVVEFLFAAKIGQTVFAGGPVVAASEWLRLDALSAFHLLVLTGVFTLSSIYGMLYFSRELAEGLINGRKLRRFALLWFGSLAAMVLVLISNNLAMMWVGIEATTLLTAFLISIHVKPASLEATWKYLIMCSVGVAFAFIGTLLVSISAHSAGLAPEDSILWSKLRIAAGALDPTAVKAGFIFILVGYGTKVGLAPMHSWLPDAHSQAPAPVSALFSGFMLNTALYCIIRYVPIVEAATGFSGWGLQLLELFGILSILVAAIFIMLQHDLKRLLAYCSVEHMGIIALGVGFGGLGTFAALFHTLNHSLCKSVSFFSAGRIGQLYNTHDMTKMGGTLRATPIWGGAMFASILALIGAAPFALFMSEFQIVKSAIESHSFWALGLFLTGTSIVFIAALRHAIHVAWGKADVAPEPEPFNLLDLSVTLLPMLFLLTLGLWMPVSLHSALDQAAAIIRGN